MKEMNRRLLLFLGGAGYKISNMMDMQMELREQHKDTWPPMEAESGRDFIL